MRRSICTLSLNRKMQPERGFTLLEIPVTLFVLVVGLLGLHMTTLMVIDSVDVGGRVSVATSLARDKTEAIKAMPYVDAVAENLPGEDYETITGFAEYARTVSIQDGVPESNSKTIQVSVSWFNAVANASRSVSISTILAAD